MRAWGIPMECDRTHEAVIAKRGLGLRLDPVISCSASQRFVMQLREGIAISVT